LKVLLYSGILISFSFFFSILSPRIDHPHENQNYLFILKHQSELQNGDLIFRKGRSLESQIVLLTDGETEYSHVGLIYNHKGKPFVIHAVPIESGEKDEFIKMQSLEDFLSNENAAKFAVYRVNESSHKTCLKASTFAYNCFQKKYSFDDQYDLKTDTKLYCTELIWKAYKNTGIDLVEDRLCNLNFIVTSKKLIVPSSIIKSKLLKKIYSN